MAQITVDPGAAARDERAGPAFAHALAARDFDKLHNWLGDLKYAYGIERVVYELNPKLHCLSPIVEKAHVTSVEELLQELDRPAPAAAAPQAVPA